MQKLLALIVLLALLVPSAFGEVTYPNTSYTLTETSLDLANVSVYAHKDIMEEYDLGTPQTDDTLQYLGLYKDVIGNEPLVPLYASENMDTIVFENLACLRNGKLIIPAANPNRGAGDPNGSLERLSRSKSFLQLGTPNGLILSPDGKYAAYVDYNMAVNIDYNYQLIILDVESGEYFLGQTWDVKIGKDRKPAAVVQAAFDENSDYLYYITYGSQNELRVSLYRYTLATGENKLLVNHHSDVARPNLIALSPNMLIAPMSKDENDNLVSGIMTYKRNLLGKWKPEPQLMSADIPPFPFRRLQANTDTGLVLATMALRTYALNADLLVLIDTNDSFKGLDSLLLFNADLTACTRTPVTEFVTKDNFVDPEYVMRSMPVLINACLTPDGKHALIIHDKQPRFANTRRDPHDYSWILLNLETLEIKNIDAPQALNSQFLRDQSPTPNDYPLGINMLSDSLVLINTENGVKLYELK